MQCCCKLIHRFQKSRARKGTDLETAAAKVVDVITYELHKVLLITNNRVIWLNSKVQKDGYNPFLGGKFQWYDPIPCFLVR